MNPNVLTVTASQSNGTISYSGTTEDGVMAVSCTLYDSTGTNDLDFDSIAVTSNAYSGTFSIAEGDYILSCANYASGTAVSTTLVAATPEQDSTDVDVAEDSAASPETGFTVAPTPAEDSAVFSTAVPAALATIAVAIFAGALFVRRLLNRRAE